MNLLSKLEIVHVFSRHFHVRIWRVLFMSLSADEFQLNSKIALYARQYFKTCINILRLFPGKKKQKKSARPL